MLFTATLWIDFLSAISVLSLLTIAYGHVTTSYLTRQRSQMFLGAAFGGLAWVQMHMPMEPMDGLIIDLRNIPIVLCGAFLGWRAGLICLAIAVATRYEIGGVGMLAGILGMIISLASGLIWEKATRHLPKRDLKHLLALSLFSSSNLFAALILPEPEKNWFINNAVLPILIMNLLAITFVAFLLELEQKKKRRAERLLAAAINDPDSGMMSRPAFEREIALRVGSGSLLPPAGLLVVDIKHHALLINMVPAFWRDKLLGLVRVRIEDVLENAQLACNCGPSRMIFPLTADQVVHAGNLQASIERTIGADAFDFPKLTSLQITVKTQAVPWLAGETVQTALKNIADKGDQKRGFGRQGLEAPSVEKLTNGRAGAGVAIAPPLPNSPMDALFGKAALLLPSTRS